MIDVDIQHLYPHIRVAESVQALCPYIKLQANKQISMRVQISELYYMQQVQGNQIEDVATNKTRTHIDTLNKEGTNESIPT